MTQNEFLKKYKDKEFFIDTIKVDETPMNIIKVDGKSLSDTELDLFWSLYPYSETKHSDPNLEIVVFKPNHSAE